MNFTHTTHYHTRALRARYYFLATLLTMCISLLSVNMVVAQDQGFARTSKIYTKSVRGYSIQLSPKAQCQKLRKKKKQRPRKAKSVAVAKRRQPKAKRLAESG